MIWRVRKSKLMGAVPVPPSKSHTIRALLVGTLAGGESRLVNPLMKGDGASALGAAIALGAACRQDGENLFMQGVGGNMDLGVENIDLGNSGTGLNMFMSAAAIGTRKRTFDGDASLRSRPVKSLLDALADLGASYVIGQKERHVPFTICGPLTGGETTVNGITSQYLSSLLMTAPLLPEDSIIHVTNLHEKPYVEITLWWLDKLGIRYEISDDFSTFKVFGNQKYAPIDLRIPGDFSGATFGAVAAAVTGCRLSLDNIDFTDPQGDKEIFTVLERAGVRVERLASGGVVDPVGAAIKGIEIDLNSMPDALPAFSVFGTVADGETRIVNVKQARIKETDRIAVMATELAKMGADITEREDGLVIRKSSLKGCRVNGHDDHRVVMSLAIAGMIAEGETIIETAESAAVTYPSFFDDFKKLGADIVAEEE